MQTREVAEQRFQGQSLDRKGFGFKEKKEKRKKKLTCPRRRSFWFLRIHTCILLI